MQSFGYPFICFVLLVVSQILIPLPSVKCRQQGVSKLDLLKMVLAIGNMPSRLIKKVRDKPILQLMGLANDIVEPFVTAAEVVLLFEELRKKLTKEEEKTTEDSTQEPFTVTLDPFTVTPDPLTVTPDPLTLTPDPLAMYPHRNKMFKSYKSYKLPVVPFHVIEQDLYLPPNWKGNPHPPYDALMHSASMTSVKHQPMLLSTGVRHYPKVNEEEEYEYFRKHYLKQSPEYEFHLVRDLPKNFAAIRRNPVRRVKKSKPTKYRRKH